MLWELFWSFFKIGCLSFGGGYAMIPVIQSEVLTHQWMTDVQYAEGVALAGMAPGPIATNSAIFVGYHTAGIIGSVCATTGIILPSAIIILLITTYLYKFHQHKEVKSAFYGLRPVIVGLIIFAAFRLAIANPTLNELSWDTLTIGVIFLAAFVGLTRYNMHPIAIIILSCLVGIAVFS